MANFKYEAKDMSNGQIIKGVIQADSQNSAARLLNEKNLFPISVISADEVVIAGIKVKRSSKIKTKDKVVFTRQLSTLVNAGLPILQALDTATEQVASVSFRQLLEGIKAQVQGGSSLSKAFALHPKVFNKTYTSLISAGEISGTLDQALDRLATQLEKEQAISSKVKGAMIYPLIVLGVIMLVLVFMLTTVVPQVALLYDDLDKTLPFATQILLAMSRFITERWYIAIPIIILFGFGLRAYTKTSNGIRFIDKLKLKMPVFGPLFRKIYMARFTRTLGSLSASGIPILEGMSITADAVVNVVIRDSVIRAIDDVKSGKTLSSTLQKDPNFLPLVWQMIKIGEDSGTLSDMLDKVASFYEEEVDQTVKNLSTLIEPIMMVVLGGMVFAMIVAVLYPIYSLVGSGVDGLGN